MPKFKTIAISAVSEADFGIGANNRLLFKLPQDLRYFRNKTRFCPIIMGYNTYTSLKAPLRDRINIVISTKEEAVIVTENDTLTIIVNSIEDAIDTSEKCIEASIELNNMQTVEEESKGWVSDDEDDDFLEEDESKSDYKAEIPENELLGVMEWFLDYDVKPEIYVIGGGQIYEQMIDYCDIVDLALVEGDYKPDTFFPADKLLTQFKKTLSCDMKDSKKGVKYARTVWERKEKPLLEEVKSGLLVKGRFRKF